MSFLDVFKQLKNVIKKNTSAVEYNKLENVN